MPWDITTAACRPLSRMLDRRFLPGYATWHKNQAPADTFRIKQGLIVK